MVYIRYIMRNYKLRILPSFTRHIYMKSSHIILLSSIIFCLTWILYANTLNNRFAFDDKSLIVENRFLREGTTLREIFTTNYRYGVGFITEGLYRPLVVATYVMNNNNLNPRPFHFFNITLNALNSPLLFLLILLLIGNVHIAFFTALIYSFHPVHTEAVANIAGRPEILCAFFILLSWIVLEKAIKHTWLLAIGALLYFAALLSKETATVVPFMIFSTDWFLKRPVTHKLMIFKYIILSTMLCLYLVVRWSILGETATGLEPLFADNPIFHSPFQERIATALSVFLRYCGVLLFPYKLSADYSYHHLPIYNSFFHIVPIFAFLIITIIITISIYFRNKLPVWGLSAILFFFPYILVSNIIFPIGTIMGERLMYLPSAGFSLFLGALLTILMNRQRLITVFAILLIIIAFGSKTVLRNREWYDDYTIFKAGIQVAPNSVKILYNMGFLSGTKGMFIEREKYYNKALEIYPDYGPALSGMGKSLYNQGRYDESLLYYEKAVSISPENAIAHYDYACVLEKIGRFQEAENEYYTAIKISPQNPLLFQGLGGLMISIGNYSLSIKYLEHALELGGNKNIILNNLAVAHYFSGNFAAASEYVKKAEIIGLRVNSELVKSINEKLQKQ